jgi:hypothetical protein
MRNWIIKMEKNGIILYEKANNFIFDFLVKEILNPYKGVLIEKIDNGFDTKYYDFSIDKYFFTLHQTPMLGILFFPTENKSLKEDFSFYEELSSLLKNRLNDKI